MHYPIAKSERTGLSDFFAPLIPLSVGIVIYWFFRGIELFKMSKVYPIYIHNKVLFFIIYSFPDALCLYAVLQTLSLIWKVQLFNTGLWWLISCVGLSLCSEFAQYYRYLPGTFDWLDIAAYLAAFIIFIGFEFSHTLKLKT